MNRLDFNQGIKAAVRRLDATREDFEEIYARTYPAAQMARMKQSLGWQMQIRSCEILKAKIDLLQGQSTTITSECSK